MSKKLTANERRVKILELLRIKSRMTQDELAEEFGVSNITIWRDCVQLSTTENIQCQPGRNGGVWLDKDIRRYSQYLTSEEEQCLYSLCEFADDYQKKLVQGIIAKFTKNTVFDTV